MSIMQLIHERIPNQQFIDSNKFGGNQRCYDLDILTYEEIVKHSRDIHHS